MKVIYIGRFQPFHKGHLSVIQDLISKVEIKEIIVGIGSAQYSNQRKNPFTVTERRKMIMESIKKNKKLRIIEIDDIHNNEGWVMEVLKKAGSFDYVYTGNEWVKSCFEKRGIKSAIPNIRLNISATKIREMISIGDSKWKLFVPEGTVRVLEEIKGEQRIVELLNN